MLYAITALFGVGFIILGYLLTDLLPAKAVDGVARKKPTAIDEQYKYLKKIQPVLRYFAIFNGRLDFLNKYRVKLDAKLLKAGNPGNLDTNEFIGLKEFVAIAVAILYVILLSKVDFFILAFIVLGFFLPDIWVNEKISTRNRLILRNLPDVLDLLTLSVEAGLDFGAAVGKVITKGKKSPLTDEFFLMQQEIKMGLTRKESLKNMAKRVELSELNSFISTLIQADQLGTSMGEVLRVQSEQMRIARSQRAEKLALEAPVKMLFPLIIFIFPTVFIIIFGPIALSLMQTSF